MGMGMREMFLDFVESLSDILLSFFGETLEQLLESFVGGVFFLVGVGMGEVGLNLLDNFGVLLGSLDSLGDVLLDIFSNSFVACGSGRLLVFGIGLRSEGREES